MQIVNRYGETINLGLEISNYCVPNKNVYIGVIDIDDGDLYADLTVWIEPLPENMVAINVNDWSEAEEFIKKFNLGKSTGKYLTSGYCTYPVYELNMENIKKYSI